MSFLHYTDIITIQKPNIGSPLQYLVDESNGDVNFNRSSSQQWEHFMIINAKRPGYKGIVYSGDKIALLTWHNRFIGENVNVVKSLSGEIDDSKTWTIYDHTNPSQALVELSSGPSNQVGSINLKSNNGKYLDRNNSGNAILQSSRVKLDYKKDERFRADFKISQRNSLSFVNCCKNKITVPTKYGNKEVCEFNRDELIVADLRGIAGEKGFFISLEVFKPIVWAGSPIILPNGNIGHPLEGHWVGPNEAPEYLVINELISNHFSGSIPSLKISYLAPQSLYKFQVAIGPTWQSEDLWFSIK